MSSVIVTLDISRQMLIVYGVDSTSAQVIHNAICQYYLSLFTYLVKR